MTKASRVRRSLVQDAIRQGALIQLTDSAVPYPYPYWLVMPDHKPPQVGQREFVELVGEVGFIWGLCGEVRGVSVKGW